MRQFPAFFQMENAHAVLFGSGEEALRKLRLLASTPARITVVDQEISPQMHAEFAGRFDHACPQAADRVLSGARLAIVALEDDARAEAAIALARRLGVPVNAVDRPRHCDFTVPSILDRGEIVAAIGSGGSAPVLAKSVRARLEALLPARIGELAALARKLRPEVKAKISSGPERRRFWEAALTGPAAERAYAGDLEGAETRMRAQIDEAGAPGGIVHIVGAGPGDPELLTLKAFRLIQEADIVFHDRLVSDDIMDLVRRDAERVAVGKRKGHHTVAQDQIHERMIRAAHAGQRVVRLKGGDPFIFGRGGEELEALQTAGVDAHVVPGISSALGCAASAGVPLTHRDHAQTLTFVTGHARAGNVPDLDWNALARTGQTVSVFMGVGTSAIIAEKLIGAGRAASTPVAVIENGTRDNEIRVFGTLARLPQLISRAGIRGPALLIVGEVAGLPREARASDLMEAVA
ncbi:MAG: uroporphyrinogen-III C-methyltransferase [Alphaproteobacteria bacterium]|jgi:uroporphyrin-III C-methyltransferase/precorrin-2 dehydrogenase/sirohydrochlorin ferrochelatase|nr:uroporphyrinogen-III C-methyltransferase [Alphaproteobacteria bacterium]